MNSNQGYDLSFLGQLFAAASDLERQERLQSSSQSQPQRNASARISTSTATNCTTSSSSNSNASSAACVSISSISSNENSAAQQPPTPPTPQRVGHGFLANASSVPISPALQQLHAPVAHSAKSQRHKVYSSSALSHIPIQVAENDKCIRIRLNLAGCVQASDIKVDVQRGILLIRGVRTIRCVPSNYDEEESADAQGNVLKSHRFCRRYAIDTDVVDITKIKANLSALGVLTIFGPKKSSPCSVHVHVTQNDDVDDMDDDLEKMAEQSGSATDGNAQMRSVDMVSDSSSTTSSSNGDYVHRRGHGFHH